MSDGKRVELRGDNIIIPVSFVRPVPGLADVCEQRNGRAVVSIADLREAVRLLASGASDHA